MCIMLCCEGVHHIANEITVHASNQVEHDNCLDDVVRVLYENGITLNRDICQLNMPKVVLWIMICQNVA